MRAQSSGRGKAPRSRGADSTNVYVKPIKIVAGNKCDLQQSRQVPAQVGLEWARKRGCGFMETSARNTVNIEETFALIVRRVVEARRLAQGMGQELDGSGRGLGGGQVLGTRRAVTAPLSPLPGGPEKEMGFGRDGSAGQGGTKMGKFKEIWNKLICWR